ncbi:pyrroline-5-carboxylate reductase [Clostridium thermosuccinogenes]|mgnify:FL=1|jgi:pyrroline-5-carboxylate reductase|uniref:Pyrroline-5-carboxylate reductase n=1 Tax=Clostridium thermosuccinogenes TaxID=84032 RepID=A0A2K2F2U6_9CLOT|nr:pyrroline-5-carboxylate reductase [Pseudoclostridium thermosuccinogenes]AUS96222.1 pyrroline-5-carboxylate reductase [Pseudoclostridium thermosuccinogenes]PNT93099.1 pyrroline-5-carboxylate reductase [Pseudoclostridium thermosuccinogenes]PNT96403.1 pyrroline-5-carboxylate reductase [Pseudoclostridium thermosuccinogenes]PNT98056.1 pyrroline-5-carboxylate reductase [Pseudoclostridium thermosuccinogenes]
MDIKLGIKLGFIGAGNMGSAMMKGILSSGLIKAGDIYMSDVNRRKLEALKEENGVNIVSCNRELVEKSDVIILAVKPNMAKEVLEPLKELIDDKKLLITIILGLPIKFYRRILGDGLKIIRTMPNTPALIGEGMILMSYDSAVGEEDIKTAKMLLESLGKVEVLDEKLMSEVTAVTGSSPAYVYMFIEAMADAAVRSGIPRNLAYELAAQAVAGSAKMVLRTGKHPGILKDEVCSPAGSTIEAVAALEKHGFRYAIMDAMEECTKKAREVGKMYE